MTNTDIQVILTKMDDNRLLQDERHATNLEQFKAINLVLENRGEKIDKIQDTLNDYQPMADAFNAMTSAGTVAKFIGKWIVMPIVVLTGLILTFKNLLK